MIINAMKYCRKNLVNTHSDSVCRGEICTIHNPTDHHMRSWRIHWRQDRGIFERICEHGVGHPDPDQIPYWKSIGIEDAGIHGCDGCCHP